MADASAPQPAPQRKRLALKPRDPEAAARLEAERQAHLASKVRRTSLRSGQSWAFQPQPAVEAALTACHLGTSAYWALQLS